MITSKDQEIGKVKRAFERKLKEKEMQYEA